VAKLNGLGARGERVVSVFADGIETFALSEATAAVRD